MQETKLFIGENLSLDGEQVRSGSLETFRERKAPPLAVLYAEWNGPLRPMSHGLSDEEFLLETERNDFLHLSAAPADEDVRRSRKVIQCLRGISRDDFCICECKFPEILLQKLHCFRVLLDRKDF